MGKYVIETPFLKVNPRAYYQDYTVFHLKNKGVGRQKNYNLGVRGAPGTLINNVATALFSPSSHCLLGLLSRLIKSKSINVNRPHTKKSWHPCHGIMQCWKYLTGFHCGPIKILDLWSLYHLSLMVHLQSLITFDKPWLTSIHLDFNQDFFVRQAVKKTLLGPDL